MAFVQQVPLKQQEEARKLLAVNEDGSRKDAKSEPSKVCECLPYTKEDVRALRRWNYSSAGLHLASFVAQLVVIIIYRNSLVQVPVSIRIGASDVLLGCVAVPWVLLAFAPLTAAFHLIGAMKSRLQSVLSNDRDGLRWTEYSITAGLMTVSIALVSGVWDLNVLLVIALLNVAVQQLGYDIEVAFNANMRSLAWRLFAWSSLVYVAEWYFIFYYFFNAVSTAGTALPWFVYTVVFTLFFLNDGFPAVVVLHNVSVKPLARFGIDLTKPRTYAIAFMVLSFVAKFVLNWFVLLGGLNARIPLAESFCGAPAPL